jgi:hypothetical protein
MMVSVAIDQQLKLTIYRLFSLRHQNRKLRTKVEHVLVSDEHDF